MRRFWPFGGARGSAAGWFVRLRSGPVTARMDAKFRRWLAADLANEPAYERQELAWEVAAELADDAEICALVEEAQQARAPRARSLPRQTWSWSAAAVALIGIAVAAAFFLDWPATDETYVAGIGEQRTVVLPDQSRMILNTDTRVRITYGRKRRLIELDRGEATFSVTHDTSRPFEVRAAKGLARALGTRFNVMSSAQGATVSVLSGRVEVIAPAPPTGGSAAPETILTTGQEVSYDGAGMSRVQKAHAARILAWNTGRIAFEDVDLAHALLEFNRYTTTPIVLEDRALGALRISGVFRIDEREAFLNALNTAFGIRAERTANGVELRAAGPQPRS